MPRWAPRDLSAPAPPRFARHFVPEVEPEPDGQPLHCIPGEALELSVTLLISDVRSQPAEGALRQRHCICDLRVRAAGRECGDQRLGPEAVRLVGGARVLADG